MRKLNICVLFGGISPEHEVSLRSAEAVLNNMDTQKYRILPVAETITENIYTEQQNVVVPETSEEASVAIKEPVKEITQVTAPQKTYSIIVASSPNAKNAELAIKELTRKKTADYTVVVGGGRHRISIGDYNSIEEANDALSLIKNTFHDAWVLTH